MAGASIRLRVDFDGLLEDIKKAGGDIDKAAKTVATECAKVMRDELVAECNTSNVPQSVSGEIGYKVIHNGNAYWIEAGWEKGEYDPRNPSAAYKAIFLNYGVPKARQVKKKTHVMYKGTWVTTANRGTLEARGFIERAKKGAEKKVKKVQKEALQKMLGELT